MATGIRFDVVFGLFGRIFGAGVFCGVYAFCVLRSASLMQVDKNEY
jgi:hypothetical protein